MMACMRALEGGQGVSATAAMTAVGTAADI